MWSVILRYSTQTYLSMAIGALIAVKTLNDSSITRKITIPVQIIYLITWPALIFAILYRNRTVLAHPRIKASIGTLYMQFDTMKNSVLHFTMSFLYRRLIFAVLICHDDYSVVLQLIPFLFSGILLLAYILWWQPMESTLFNFLAALNEAMLLIMGYLMYTLTEYVP